MQHDLLSGLPSPPSLKQLAELPITDLADGAFMIRGGVTAWAEQIFTDIGQITAQAPGRRPYTPGGRVLSAALSCCGAVGWVSDQRGYRYQATDPLSGTPWPRLPALWGQLAQQAAACVGYLGFSPDTCLVNRYGVGDGMGLHQDRDEADYSQPIVSFSLGLGCIFLWGGPERTRRPRRIPLLHGDVFVWGGKSRLWFHGISPLAAGTHPLTGRCRYNLTFRRALP